MRSRCYAVLVAAVFVLAAPAEAATTLVRPDGSERPQPWQEWVDRARVPTPDARVTLIFDAQRCRGRQACTDGATIWMGRPFWPRYAILHELGHVFDGLHLTDSDRGTFTALMRDERPWEDQVEETFADAFFACAMNGRRHSVYTPVYDPPGRQGGRFQHRKVCRLIRQVASS